MCVCVTEGRKRQLVREEDREKQRNCIMSLKGIGSETQGGRCHTPLQFYLFNRKIDQLRHIIIVVIYLIHFCVCVIATL